MNREREKPGLTLIEILTVIAIIALLIGILIPAVTVVKDAAKEVKQRGQFMTIEIGLTAFKNDFGDYPPSYYTASSIYCGSQKMTEALLGWDLAGFHPDSAWRLDGLDAAGGPLTYDPGKVRGTATFNERKKPYLESGTQYAFKLREVFAGLTFPITSGIDTYVLCDVYGATKVASADGSWAKAGAPILYYKADPSGRLNAGSPLPIIGENNGYTYNYTDNQMIVMGQEMKVGASDPAFSNSTAFYEYIQDPKITAKPTAYNQSSYILISAGPDGIYGTPDDIRNFGD